MWPTNVEVAEAEETGTPEFSSVIFVYGTPLIIGRVLSR